MYGYHGKILPVDLEPRSAEVMMGGDEQGVPRPATLYDHHLEWVLGGDG